VDHSPEDLREVGNYVVALEHGISRLKKLPLYVRLTREIDGLLAEWQKKVSGESSNNPLRVVELLGANPFITTKGVADKFGDRVCERAARH